MRWPLYRRQCAKAALPAVVREGLVGLGHAVDVVLALERVALLLLGVEQFMREALGHRLLAPLTGELDQPAHREGARSARGHLNGHLVGRSADTAGANLEYRRERLDAGFELLDRVLAAALGQDRQCVVDDLLRHRLLAVEHHLVDDLLDDPAAIHGIGLDWPDLGGCATRHRENLLLHAVLRASLLAIPDSSGVQRAPNHLVAEPRQVLDPSPAHEHHRVLLQVVAFAGDVGADLHAVGQTHTRDLAQRGVRLLRRGRVDARAHAAALGRGDLLLAALAGLEARSGELLLGRGASLANQLASRWHSLARLAGAALRTATAPWLT